jgi:8-oxo-dGTP pyrophosphatase MutT (NUDIX family)
MRISQASMALITRAEPGATPLWLAQWNDKWQAFNLVGGHRKAEENARECCLREVAEELNLRPGVEFEVAAEPLAVLRYEAFSQSAQTVTRYEMTLFEVTLGNAAHPILAADPANRWLTTAEIQAEQCADGKRVSETMARLLRAAGLLAQ